MCVLASLPGCRVVRARPRLFRRAQSESLPEKTQDSLHCPWLRRSQSPVWLRATVPTLPVESLEVSLPQPPRLCPPIITHHTSCWTAGLKLIKRIMCSRLIKRRRDYSKHRQEDWQPLHFASFSTVATLFPLKQNFMEADHAGDRMYYPLCSEKRWVLWELWCNNATHSTINLVFQAKCCAVIPAGPHLQERLR